MAPPVLHVAAAAEAARVVGVVAPGRPPLADYFTTEMEPERTSQRPEEHSERR